MIALREYSWY